MGVETISAGRIAPDVKQELMSKIFDCEGNLKFTDEKTLIRKDLSDSYETAVDMTDVLCACYTDNRVITGMPKSIFADRFGYDMQKSISGCMADFYAGKIDQSGVADFFEKCCLSMRIYRTQQRQTSGTNAEDNREIVSRMYEIFAKENQRAARSANYKEGEALNRSYGGRTDDWVYYNSDYYYQCENTREFLGKTAQAMADKWELSEIDTTEIEKKSDYTLDGGFDFNSGWNFTYRNQVGRGSIEDESLQPPANFKFFYKEATVEKGQLELSLNGRKYRTEVPFSISRDGGLRGQIHSVNALLDGALLGETGMDFLKHVAIFTRWYSFKSGINDIFGSYISKRN